MTVVSGVYNNKAKQVAVDANGNVQTAVAGTNVKGFGKVTPSDTTDLATPAIAIAVEVSGALSVVKLDGTTELIPAVLLPAGVILPFPVKRIRATGTTASGVWVFN
ncbi:hypothetical protein D3C79_640680 [compost metagenome]